MELDRKDILYEDKHIIVCRKPSGIATQTARAGMQDMESLIKNYLRSAYIGVIHRLDQPVEGILVFGKTKKGAAQLSRQNRERLMGKRYYAVVLADSLKGMQDGQWHTLSDYLKKEEKGNASKVVPGEAEGGKLSILHYQWVKQLPFGEEEDKACVLVRIELETGRHHQIRVQLAHNGQPLIGDSKYGSQESNRVSRERGIKDVALCCHELEFIHPITGKGMFFSLEPSGAAFLPFFQ